MAITLQTLKFNNTVEFEKQDRDYFTSLGKAKWDIVDLIVKCKQDNTQESNLFALGLLYLIEDTIVLTQVVDKLIAHNITFVEAFDYCNSLFKQDRILFSKFLNYHIQQGLKIKLIDSNDCLIISQQDSIWHKQWVQDLLSKETHTL
jgi:hypothetical protein